MEALSKRERKKDRILERMRQGGGGAMEAAALQRVRNYNKQQTVDQSSRLISSRSIHTPRSRSPKLTKIQINSDMIIEANAHDSNVSS